MTEPREALARLRRVETRPAGRGMVIVHEIDESHPANNSCDICALVTLRSEGPGLDATRLAWALREIDPDDYSPPEGETQQAYYERWAARLITILSLGGVPMNYDRAALEPESDAEAGAYIEDDPVAWEAFCAALYRYHEYIPALKERVGEDAIKIVAGSMLAFMADEHQTFVWARPRAIAADWARSEGPGLDAPSLDEGLLARALRATRHRITYVTTDGLTWATPDLEREEAAAIAAEYRRLAQEGETP